MNKTQRNLVVFFIVLTIVFIAFYWFIFNGIESDVNQRTAFVACFSFSYLFGAMFAYQGKEKE